MNIFISGASGYLGSHLAKELSRQHQVVALVRKTSSRDRIKDLPIEIVNHDYESNLENAFEKYAPDVVINTAGVYGRKGESLSALIEANIAFPANLLCMAKKYNAKAFINTGTSLPSTVSLYAKSKNTFVELASLHEDFKGKNSNAKRLKFINIALEHFYGPKDDSQKFTSYVMNACIKNQKLALTEGQQKRDFIFIDDVISAYDVIIENLNMCTSFETIAVGSGIAPTVKEFVQLVHSCCKSDALLDFGAVPMRKDELMYSCANTLRLEQLSWHCHYSLLQGINATLKREKS